MNKSIIRIAVAGIFALSSVGVRGAEPETCPAAWETPQQHDARMQWFRDAKFGMFIHWGLYSQLAGEWQDKTVGGGAEWIQNTLAIPSSQYSQLAKHWNPAKYDPRAWVHLMKSAGIKYIAVTTKHHDGFCLWPTKLNDDWNISITPNGKDLLNPLAEACAAEGVRFGIYHSIPDWHHPDWPARPAFNDYAKDRGAPDLERYKKEYLFPQLRELLTNYGKVSLLWLDDGGMARPPLWSHKDGQDLEEFIRSVDREVVLDDRSQAKPFISMFSHGGVVDSGPAAKYTNHSGDYITPEGAVPATGLPGIDWETCQTMQLPNNWGFNRLVGFRPFKDLLHQLIDVTSKGGNMLLNIGPTAEGEIPPQARFCLEKFGLWMKDNSESIHGTTATPFESLPFEGRCTQKPGKLFLHVFAWPQDGKLLVPVRNPLKRVYLLAGSKVPLECTRRKHGIEIALPPLAPDPVATVVVVEIEGKPEVLAPAKPVSQGKPVTVSAEWRGRPTLNKENITDGLANTFWAGPENSRTGWAQIDLGADTTVTGAMLSEGPGFTRCGKFDIQAQVGGEWKTVVSGTGIGLKKELVFPSVKARLFRVNVTADKPAGAPDGEPVIAEFQLTAE